jgi:hypothetical protein
MKNQINNVGFGAAIAACAFAMLYVVVQLLQVVRAIRFPMDEILIYGSSLGIVLPFVLAMLALHYRTPADRRFWTHAALIFSILYAVFVTANYVVQLATVVPATLRGTSDQIEVLRQTPHSMFWNFDALGYIFMGLAMLVALPAISRDGPERWLRRSFLANALVTPLIAVVYFYPVYSEQLLLLGYPWAITAPLAMLMLAFSFRRQPARGGST